MGIGIGAALLLSSAITAGAGVIQGQKARSAQRRIAAQQEALRKRTRASQVRESESAKAADRVAARLQKAKVRDLRNDALATRGISSFGDISEAVLTDRAT